MKKCRNVRLPDPQFMEGGEYFKVIFSRSVNIINPKENSNQVNVILRVITENGDLTQLQIAEASKVPFSRVKKIMSDLQKDGKIEGVGRRRSASWKVNG